jgi:hypothetical protein
VNRGFTTSMYVAHIGASKFPNLSSLRDSIYDTIKRKENELNQKGFVIYDEEKSIRFYEPSVRGVLISYKTNFIPKDKIILLSFYPRSNPDYGKDPKYWGKLQNLSIGKKVLEFVDIIGSEFEVVVENYGALKFERVSYVDYIDISNWNVILFDKISLPLSRVIKNWKIVYDQILENSKKTKYLFVIFSSIPFSKEIDYRSKKLGKKAIERLKQELQKFGEVEGPYNSLKFKYHLEGYSRGSKLMAIFIEDDEIISNVYKNFKKYLDIRGVPSQFVSVNTVNQKFGYPKIKLNFLLEILTKIEDNNPVFIKPTRSVSSIDGVLCLSDVKDASKMSKHRLFGALFMYTLSNKYEEIQIYEDINYEVRKGHIIFEPDSLSRLADYVLLLTGLENLKIDIFLTRPWNKKDLQDFIEKLLREGYEVNRVYYISTLRARSTDEAILNNQLKLNNIEYKVPNTFRQEISEYWHFYSILSEHVAMIRTSTQLRIYPTLFNIYVELMWPETASLSREDIEKILWFTKKRLYRFQEFFVTKVPEPIWIFRNLRKIYLGEITETIRIPLRLML